MSGSAPPLPPPDRGVYDPDRRAAEKRALRERDAAALDSREKSPEQLRAERGSFAFPHVRIDLDGIVAFE
jgi:hypothetical protein